jgi:hypothetical protein
MPQRIVDVLETIQSRKITARGLFWRRARQTD